MIITSHNNNRYCKSEEGKSGNSTVSLQTADDVHYPL